MARSIDTTLPARILVAAAREFADRGYSGARLNTIADRAGVTKGGVYFCFANKEELFFAALDQARAALETALLAAPAAPNSAAELRGFLAAFLAFHARHPEAAALARVLETELRGRFTTQAREDLRNAQRRLRARLRELLAAGAQDGSLFANDPAFAAFLMAGSVEGIVAQGLRSPRDVEPFFEPEVIAEALVAPYRLARPDAARRAQADQQAAGDEDFRPAF